MQQQAYMWLHGGTLLVLYDSVVLLELLIAQDAAQHNYS
jgi:hypothetical protein